MADPTRQRLRLSSTALAAAVLLLPGRLDDDRLSDALREELPQLEAAGVVHQGELVPWVARHLLLLLAPDLHVEAVVGTEAGESMTQVWARPDVALIGRTDGGAWVDLAPTEPRLLAWALYAEVGLPTRSDASATMRGPIDPARVARFGGALSSRDHQGAGAVLDDVHDLSTDELAVMAALAAGDGRAWRITATWTSAAGPVHRWLSVIDAAHAGLWCSEGSLAADAECPVAESPAAELLPASPADVWQRLLTSLPPGTSTSPGPSLDDDRAHPGRPPCPAPAPLTPTASSGSFAPSTTSTSG